MRNFSLTLLLFVNVLAVLSQEQVIYKQVDSIKLGMEVFRPNKESVDDLYPAIVFFFGGGWQRGSLNQFKAHANYLSQRGMVCFLVDYRVNKRHQTTPFESLKDAKSAIRFIRANARKWHVNPEQIVAAGGSAGGHLAAASALIDHYDDVSDSISVSCKPNALIFFNPVIDNGPGGYGYERIGDAYKDFSPLHNIIKDAPPTIMFLGTEDHLIPVETVKYYQTVMEKVGSRCDLYLYDGEGHGFFNRSNLKFYQETLVKADSFLISINYLQKEPYIEIR